MATFKVGQRARILFPESVRAYHPEDVMHGCETTVTSEPLSFCGRIYYRTSAAQSVEIGGIWAEYLHPLIDPKADAFLESVKSWKPEPVAPPLPVKERA